MAEKTFDKKAKKSRSKKTRTKKASDATTKPKFPYTNKPNSLRRFLELIPDKPRPAKINADTLKAWGLKDTNDQSIIRVLKALDLVSPANEPTQQYTDFMTPGLGPSLLASSIRTVWAPLFEHSHEPHREDDSTLRNYFNIHSGGSDATIAFQIQSFKAACDHADFSNSTSASSPAATTIKGRGTSMTVHSGAQADQPAIHIDLHIHLPENKSRRDYEYMFEDIAKYLFGRDTDGGSGD